MQLHDNSLNRETILLNGAGSSIYNPIFIGLPFKIQVVFNATNHTITATADGNAFTLTQNSSQTNLYEYNAIAGSTPFTSSSGKHTLRVLFTSQTGEETLWEKDVYFADFPTDAIQVWDASAESWKSIPSEIPVCCMQCPIRFFNSWETPTGVKTYGGAKYVSIIDGDATEDDEYQHSDEVLYEIEKKIAHTTSIYLVKNLVKQQEEHSVKFVFHSQKGDVGYSVAATIKSTACFGAIVYNPATT